MYKSLVIKWRLFTAMHWSLVDVFFFSPLICVCFLFIFSWISCSSSSTSSNSNNATNAQHSWRIRSKSFHAWPSAKCFCDFLIRTFADVPFRACARVRAVLLYYVRSALHLKKNIWCCDGVNPQWSVSFYCDSHEYLSERFFSSLFRLRSSKLLGAE